MHGDKKSLLCGCKMFTSNVDVM